MVEPVSGHEDGVAGAADGDVRRGLSRTRKALVIRRQCAPLRGVGRFVFANEFFQQGVLGLRLVDQRGLDGAMHGQVVPGRHTHEVRVNLGRQVSVRAQKSHHSLRPGLQQPPVRIAAGHMPQQNGVQTLLAGDSVLQLQR